VHWLLVLTNASTALPAGSRSAHRPDQRAARERRSYWRPEEEWAVQDSNLRPPACKARRHTDRERPGIPTSYRVPGLSASRPGTGGLGAIRGDSGSQWAAGAAVRPARGTARTVGPARQGEHRVGSTGQRLSLHSPTRDPTSGAGDCVRPPEEQSASPPHTSHRLSWPQFRSMRRCVAWTSS
jgi:hypothetical protein